MQQIMEFTRQELREPSYYLGSGFWALGSVLSDLGKMKKAAIDSGLASLDLNYVVKIYNFSALLAFGISLLFLMKIWHKLRVPFTSHHPSLWSYSWSWTWMSIKATFLMLITLLPAVVYAARNYLQAVMDPTRFALIMGTLTLVMAPFWFVLFYGANSILIARGNAHRAIRDGLKGFRYIWKESFLVMLLIILPTLILAPIRVLSFKFPILEFIAIGLNASFAPYTFGIMGSTYLYLGKRLNEKAAAFVARNGTTSAPAPEHPA